MPNVKSLDDGGPGGGSRRFSVADVQVRCPHCGGEAFDDRAAMIPMQRKTFVGVDYPNRPAVALICTACRHMEWFLEGTDSI